MKHKSLFLFLLNVFCVFANQKVDKYVATSMYDIPMVMEPISANILKPHSSTSQTLATFDLAYTTANGQNRLIEDLPKLMSQPKKIPSVTKVVTGSGQLQRGPVDRGRHLPPQYGNRTILAALKNILRP